MKTVILVKRVYEEAEELDGVRILVDRLWPRGVKKEAAAIDDWAKELAPTDELRKWFAHDPAKWQAFEKKYTAELSKNKMLEEFITNHKKGKKITLLYAAKDQDHNNAQVLKKYLADKL